MPKRQGRVLTKEDFEKEAERHREVCQKRKLDRMRHESVLNLDPTLRKFCMHIAEGKSSADAASLCGYEDPGKTAKTLLRRTDVRKALNVMIRKTIRMSEITREDIIEGFKDAIAIARQQSEAMGMIAGYREIGKMLGMYETKVKVEITGGASEIQRQLQGKSDAELLRLIQERSAIALPKELTEIEEGEFEEVQGDE